MDVTMPYRFILFGHIHGSKPYALMRSPATNISQHTGMVCRPDFRGTIFTILQLRARLILAVKLVLAGQIRPGPEPSSPTKVWSAGHTNFVAPSMPEASAAHNLKVSDRRRNRPTSAQNRSESLCVGLRVPCRICWARFGQTSGADRVRSRRFPAGSLKISGPLSRGKDSIFTQRHPSNQYHSFKSVAVWASRPRCS